MAQLYTTQVNVGDSVIFEGRLRVVTGIFQAGDGTYRFRLDKWEIVPCTECSLTEDDLEMWRRLD